MTFRTILVAVDDSVDSDTRLAFAGGLARSMKAHLIGVCGVSLNLPPIADPYTGGALLGESFTVFRELAEGEIASARARFEALRGPCPEGSEWRSRIGLPADVVVEASRAADLVIVGRRSATSPDHAVDPADVLMAAGRPVLIQPPNPDRHPSGRPAIIAWKEGREARRAAAAALPLLRQASEVHVVTCCEPDARDAARAQLADVVAWLGRHGISAEARAVTAGSGHATREILALVEDLGAGLIVAGAYGHSRLREWALGGVTRDLLALAPVCVLLTH